MGTVGECTAAVDLLRRLDGVDVVEVSDARPNRGDSALVRVYVEARMTGGRDAR